MKAKCGHEDPMGYLIGSVCGKCVRANHRRAVAGLPPLPTQRKGDR